MNENETPADPFEGCSPVPGLEHLGRAIVDANGAISGSPANFEETRGAWHPAGITYGNALMGAVREVVAGANSHEEAVAAVRDLFSAVGMTRDEQAAISEADIESLRIAMRAPTTTVSDLVGDGNDAAQA